MVCFMTRSVDLRNEVLRFIEGGGGKVEACSLFNVSRSTIYNWLSRDDIRPKAHGMRHRKIDKDALLRHVEAFPDMFLRERAAMFGVHYTSISRALRKLGVGKKNADLRGERP